MASAARTGINKVPRRNANQRLPTRHYAHSEILPARRWDKNITLDASSDRTKHLGFHCNSHRVPRCQERANPRKFSGMPSTFKSPPVDTSSLVPHWVQYNARNSPDHPLFTCGDANSEPTSITWLNAAQAFGRAARIISPLDVPAQDHGQEPKVFGILANLDFTTYYTLAMGIFTAGCTPFLISTRNSPAAVSHLLKKTGAKLLFVSPDEQTQRLALSAQEGAQADGNTVELLAVPAFQTLYPEGNQEDSSDNLPVYPKRDLDSPAFILHSSGTTAFPKPITVTHRGFMQAAQSSALAEFNSPDTKLGAHSLPPFHAMAFLPFAACIYQGHSLAVMPPRSPPVIPSPANVLDAAVACNCTLIFVVPFFIELWSRNPVDVEKLKSFHAVMFAGGPLKKQIGDELSREGVALCSLYAGTEIGAGCKLTPKKYNRDWAWHQSFLDRTVFLPQNDDTDVFEIVFVEGPRYQPSIFNFDINGKRAFATNDLVVLHPNDPTKFMIYGRKDDQLMLSTGEKTNPGPLEAIICKHPQVHSAVYFGRGKTQNGVLIQPAPGHAVDPTDSAAVARFRNDIWTSVEEANAYAPTHSRIYKEMILIASPSKPFEMTIKLAPRKPAVIQAYSSEIEAIYAAAEESVQTVIPPPSQWTPEQVLPFVRDTVISIMDVKLGDDDDIFVNGADSLKATYIRNSLIYALRGATEASSSALPQSFVYSNPTITLLVAALLAIVHRNSTTGTDEVSRKLKEMDEMIAEFCVDFPQHQPCMPLTHSSSEVVLLTGTTGALGAELLAHMFTLPEISCVYALNRPGGDGASLKERQIDGLLRRGLDTGIVDSPKLKLVEGDTAAGDLGIASDLFEEIRDSVTLIIHNAWRVNFNIGMRSFKPMVKGVRNLVDLALHSPRHVPPRIIFTSSVGVFNNWKGPGSPLERPIDDPRVALGNGYGESKFVAERILERASKATSLRPVIVRIGQMTSNSSGAWNSGDWIPAIVRSGQVVGALPARNDTESVAWIPIDATARAIMDFRKSEFQHLHLVHPNPVPWNTLFEAFSSLLNVPLVSWSEWLIRLEKNELGPKNNPAAHLVGFFRNFPDVPRENAEAPGIPLMDITQALKSSPSISKPSLSRLGPVDAERWVAYWMKNEHLVRIRNPLPN